MADQATPAPAAAPATPAAAAPPARPSVDAIFNKAKGIEPAKTAETAKVADKPAEDSVAKQLALIARENKRLAAEREAFKKEQDGHKERLSAAEKLEALQKTIKSDPLRALKEFGLDYQQLVQVELQRQEDEANPTLKKVRELEQKLTEKERHEAEMAARFAQQQHQSLVDNHIAEIAKHIASNADKFEFLSTYKAEKDVFDLIKNEFDASVKKDETGKIVDFKELTIAEACERLEAQYEESATKITALKKIQAKMAAKQTPVAPTKPQKEKSVTLTNAPDPSKPHILSRDERRERAWQALHGGART